MATKTISVDLEAYDRLARARSTAKESFSQVIKRATWPPKHGTAAQLLQIARSHPPLTDETLDALDERQDATDTPPDRWAEDGKPLPS